MSAASGLSLVGVCMAVVAAFMTVVALWSGIHPEIFLGGHDYPGSPPDRGACPGWEGWRTTKPLGRRVLSRRDKRPESRPSQPRDRIRMRVLSRPHPLVGSGPRALSRIPPPAQRHLWVGFRDSLPYQSRFGKRWQSTKPVRQCRRAIEGGDGPNLRHNNTCHDRCEKRVHLLHLKRVLTMNPDSRLF